MKQQFTCAIKHGEIELSSNEKLNSYFGVGKEEKSNQFISAKKPVAYNSDLPAGYTDAMWQNDTNAKELSATF